MERVCMQEGRVIVIDATPPSDKADMYNYVERLRDPSHVKALTLAELLEMFKEQGLTIINTDSYGVEMDLGGLLLSSFPNPGNKDKIRRLFIEDVQHNTLGVNSYYVGTEIHFTYPTSIDLLRN
jgi:hypothetical protein